MGSIFRRSQTIKGISFSKRFFSSPAVTINEELLTSFDSYADSGANERTNSKIYDNKVGNILRTIPSEAFLNSLSEAHFSSTLKLDSKHVSRNQLIKTQIYKLIEIKDFDSLLQLFLQLTSSVRGANLWQSVIMPEELSFYVGYLIKHQINLINQVANYKLISRNSTMAMKKLSEARFFRENIRRLYNNLIYTSSKENIYHESKRMNLYNSANLTGYKLTVNDYENLILLELHNLKLDLASKWFQRFENEFPNHMELMTYNMWILKLQTYCGGLPTLWKVNETELSNEYYNPRRSKFKSEIPFIKVFNEFLSHQSKTKDSSIIIDNKFNESLIYSIGYSRNLDYLMKYIELSWGITSDGKLANNYEKISKNNLNYPDISILKAIVISFSYNQEFFKAMKYINGFQDHYSINLSSLDSKNFWEQVFRWCNFSTKFNEERALQYYLTENSLFKDNKSRKLSLKDAQKNAEFDYEGYLSFISNLKDKRSNTFNELWSVYNETNKFFSSKIYKTYLNYLNEQIESEELIESKYYDLLTRLLKQYHCYSVSIDSFNKRTVNKINDTDKSIYLLYEQTLKSLIDYKWKSTYMGQCQPLINEWSIDEPMKDMLTDWFRADGLPKYREMIEKKREEIMVSLRTEEKDSFLDLI